MLGSDSEEPLPIILLASRTYNHYLKQVVAQNRDPAKKQ